VTYFLKERIDALNFIAREESVSRLSNPEQLAGILRSLKIGFGGFVDIGLINKAGEQIQYAGPFNLTGKAYGEQKWFETCVKQGFFVSDVFLGYRNIPHMFIAVKSPARHDAFFILRAALDTKQLVDLLSSLDISAKSDAFISNTEGLLQTASKYSGNLLEKISLSIPPYNEHTQTYKTRNKNGEPLLVAYAYIQDSPFILMLATQPQTPDNPWRVWRNKMTVFLGWAIVFILTIIALVPAYTVNRIVEADKRRLHAMRRMESDTRLASIGRLAAGVAHEINNPLAIINENAGYIKDLFTIEKKFTANPQLLELIDDVLESVERCGTITKQLLDFARHFEPQISPVKLHKVVHQVLSFLKKEASYRNIQLTIDIPEDLPELNTDRGKLQQIFLNLFNNAFQAMAKGGELTVKAAMCDNNHVTVSVQDNGYGISDEHKKQIFEPFFSTKTKAGGTGLGLSITYGMVNKLEGKISVSSELGKGTTFSVTLPLTPKGENQNEYFAG
jgi:signal transduction histidine kinase